VWQSAREANGTKKWNSAASPTVLATQLAAGIVDWVAQELQLGDSVEVIEGVGEYAHEED
jgi:hypothetical protein